MGFDSIWHWLILLVVVLLLFGTSKLRNAGSDIGTAVRNFKKAMHEGEEAKDATTERLQADPQTTDAKAGSKTQDHAP